ncbi:MAG: ABC transporter permease subunit [Lachnospiraceae bacterium]|nr:ABC transporter permease subunit [Lachnospiraceae bacterium]
MNAKKRTWKYDFKMNKGLYLLSIPVIAYFFVFSYLPMGGLLMAFENYKPARGLLGSEWVGLQNFIDFFTGPNFYTILRNTLVISLLSLVIAFPLTIVYALLLNEIKIKWFKKTVQTIHYLPYFVSMVVICSLIRDFVATNGFITNIMVNVFGIQRQNLLQNPDYFWAINLLSDIWQGLAYGAIFFVAAISGVSQELHEAAAIDGANRLQRAWHVTIPGIMPSIITMLVLKCGTLLSVGSDKILLLYNSSIYSTADVISTHVQRMGIEQMNYGYSTAVGLFNSVVGTILLLGSNALSAKLTDTSII